LKKKTGLLGVLALAKRESGKLETSTKFGQNIKFLSIIKNKGDKKDENINLRDTVFKDFKDFISYN